MLIVTGCAACTPRSNRYTVTNNTDVTLVAEDGEVAPGETGTVWDRGPECIDSLPLVASDRSRTVVIDGPLCDGDTAEVSQSDLADTSATATVLNESSHDLVVSIWGDHGFWREPVSAGAHLIVTLKRPPGGCTEGKVYAADPAAPAGNAVVVHADPVCDGEVWGIDDDDVDAGSAAVTVTNQTDYAFSIGVVMVLDWGFQQNLDPGDQVQVTLGLPPGGCVDGWIEANSIRNGEREGVRATLDGPLCDSEWVMTDADLTHWENSAHDWVPFEPATDAG